MLKKYLSCLVDRACPPLEGLPASGGPARLWSVGEPVESLQVERVALCDRAPACPAGAVGRPAAQAGVFSFSLSTFSLSTMMRPFLS